MQSKEESIYTIYFDLYDKYNEIYGKKTIVLLQVGAFFEIYGVRTNSNIIACSNIEEISILTQLSIADKGNIKYIRSSTLIKGDIVMAGFRDYRLDYYSQLFTENGYTVVVYIQKKDSSMKKSQISRELYQIYSPGSFIPFDSDSTNLSKTSNNTMCIWFDSYIPMRSQIKQPQIIYGLSTINIFTGETTLYEHETLYLKNPTTFDELERFLSMIQPTEVIIISTFDEDTTRLFMNYSGLRTQSIHTIFLNNNTLQDSSQKMIDANNCTKQTYMNHILSTHFGEDAYTSCQEFQQYPIATQAFCYLLNFIQSHNPDLVRKIEAPIFHNLSTRMCLANHTLKQLNIISDGSDDSKSTGHLSSLLSFLNKTSTAIGSRLLKSQLTNPIFNSELLNREYEMTAYMLEINDSISDNNITIDWFRKALGRIKDLEKISRQLILKKIYPATFYQFYSSILCIREIFNGFSLGNYSNVDSLREKFIKIQEYLCGENSNIEIFSQNIDQILEFIQTHLKIEQCSAIRTISSFEVNIIQDGISEKIDKLSRELIESTDLFERIRDFFNGHMRNTGTDSEDDTEYIKVHQTEKSGVSLQITKKRGLILKSILERIAVLQTNGEKTSDKIINITPDFQIPLKDIRFVKATTSNDEIEFPQLDRILKKMLILKQQISELVSEEYLKVIDTFEQLFYDKIHSLGKYIGKLDVLLTRAYIAKKYHYCRPIIDSNTGDNTAEKSFVNATGLRHPLIEHLQQNETYVTNDITIGNRDGDKEVDGFLIYGTNAVGKTSFIRAVGVSIIMAQSGFYVPCTEFIFKPYTAIFSRILGNDNIFKGLSTFAVEMSELRIILRLADKNSLILGDELCSGTEAESALAIFTTGLMELHEKRSTFLFATHFHEICDYEEIQSLDRLQIKHMAVHYDPTIDALIYDRLLKPGPGTRMYGLEVCKSLYLGNDFLEKAYAIRNKYHPTTNGELSFETSHFNKAKVVGFCEICKTELAEEVHHLTPQRDADKNGFIQTDKGVFHKNHLGNIVSLCNGCHNKQHQQDKVILKKKKTTKGYILSEG